MVAHCRLTNEQTIADQLVLQSLTNERGYFPLAAGERRNLGSLRVDPVVSRHSPDHFGSERAIEPHLASVNLFDGLEEILNWLPLKQYSHGPPTHGPVVCLGVAHAS